MQWKALASLGFDCFLLERKLEPLERDERTGLCPAGYEQGLFVGPAASLSFGVYVHDDCTITMAAGGKTEAYNKLPLINYLQRSKSAVFVC